METTTLRAEWPCDGLVWTKDPPAGEWDCALAALFGHPLQSSVWGRARELLDGIKQHRWLACHHGEPVWMIRVEERMIPMLGPIGWAPRGPAGLLTKLTERDLPLGLREHLREAGLMLLVTDLWIALPDKAQKVPQSGPRTIWVDLTNGAEAAFGRLDKKWRNGVRRAAKEGVVVQETTARDAIHAFADLCMKISRIKKFRLDISPERIQALIENPTLDADARLFVARRSGSILAGALVLRVGRSWHYFWGGTNRSAGDFRAGEAVQWAIIETAIAEGGVRYDLEGIDDEGNAGTAAFKRKMGGIEVALPGHEVQPLGLRGRALALAMRLRH